jgi:hypothetical protein
MKRTGNDHVGTVGSLGWVSSRMGGHSGTRGEPITEQIASQQQSGMTPEQTRSKLSAK